MYSHLRLFKVITFLLLLTMLGLPFQAAAAQDQTTSDYPVYIVQQGDTLGAIAARFGVSTDAIIQLNQISDPNLVTEGTRLQIPGLEGVSGVLTTTVVSLGQSTDSLVRQYQLSEEQLSKLNRLTSPAELYAGSTLIIPQTDTQAQFVPQGSVASGGSLLDLAAGSNANPWTLVLLNDLENSSSAVPGETLYRTAKEGETSTGSISPLIEGIEISPLPLVQGSTAEIRVKTTSTLTLTGSLNGRDLHFFPYEDGYVALQGIFAMAETGPAPFELSGVDSNNQTFSFQQNVLIQSGHFANDATIYVDPATVDKSNTQPEEDQVTKIVSQVTSEKMWDGMFVKPIDVPTGYSMVPDCRTDSFGNRRSYNDGPYESFHSGVDLSKCGLPGNIYASAAGTVVFTGSLVVRGNYTVIDHGWGVFSAYGHQSEIDVKVGDHVEAGQLIGVIGATGRVDGPHLHWEIWVNGVLVQPLDWLDQVYP